MFVVGCPRAGLSFLVEMLGAHEDLGWISNVMNWARIPWRVTAALNRAYDLPIVGKRLWRARLGANAGNRLIKLLPYPTEPWEFWQTRIARFTPRERDLWLPEAPTNADILPEESARVRRDVASLLAIQGRSRLLSYYAGHGRMRLLSVPFPDAVFVHVIRDVRAVAESFHRMIEAGGFRTWEERDLWPRVWPERWRRMFVERYRNPFGLCVYLWMHFTTSIREEGRSLAGNRYVEVRYEDLNRRPTETLEKLLSVSGLRPSERMSWLARCFRPRNDNSRWRSVLTRRQLQTIDEILDPELRDLLDISESGP